MDHAGRRLIVAWLLLGAFAPPAAAQWTNRYPKIQGASHHVYLEGYELPTLTVGPIDPAVSPDGRRVAVASRGWLWLLDKSTGMATRLTRGGGIDARPAWSPDGTRIAFVRDDTRATSIVEIEVATRRERVVIDEPAINLDPAYGPDGRTLYYSSAAAGDLDLWRVDLAAGTRTRMTEAAGQEVQPVPLADGRVAYIAKGAGNDVRVRNPADDTDRVIASGPILSMTRIAASPDGRTLAVTWPKTDASGWTLVLYPVDGSPFPIHLTAGQGQPLTPAWTPDGKSVLFAEADDRQRMHLYEMPAAGGRPSRVEIASWDWGEPVGRLRVDTKLSGATGTTPARLAVTDSRGHPLVPDEGQPRFDGQNGVVFFYSTGSIELTAPLGDVTVTAVQGLATPAARTTTAVAAGSVALADLTLTPVWDARSAGWFAGDHHFHLNYGGPYQLPTSVLAPMARAEGMDVLTPLLANLHTRFEDQSLFRWSALDGTPLIAFGQEVRSHFLGHVGLIGTDELFWPWIWGPGYEVHGRDDRTNSEVLAFARAQGGVSTYVHPISVRDPFSEDGIRQVPVELAADGILGLFDTIELICLWSDEIGSMAMWYRLLNFGSPVAASAGTDVMNNFYRTMAIGTTRLYVRSDPAAGYRGYLEGMRRGTSFVTSGPMLEFTVDAAGPGEILPTGGRNARFRLAVHSAVAVDSVEIVINGAVTARLGTVAAGTSRTFEGTLRLPAGGWVAARALGGPTTGWPAMDSYAFAHTSPLWIGAVGSTTPATRQSAAADLSRVLGTALERLRAGYQGTPIPSLEAHFARAQARVDSVRTGVTRR